MPAIANTMKSQPLHSPRFFFATAPLPCPYHPDRTERRVVTELVKGDDPALHDALFQAGFRRSHNIAYVPACPTCQACVAVRTVVSGFTPSRSHKRVLKRNADVLAIEKAAVATAEQFDLFSDYLRARHGDGDMAKMDSVDFKTLIEESAVDTAVMEFRDPDGRLIAACLTDRLGDGISAVYSFFATDLQRRGLGTYMILWLIERALRLELPYVYLGYWISDVAKMSYKSRFRPAEIYTAGGWRPLVDGDEEDGS